MNKVSIIEKSATIRVGKEPMVLVPLKLWRKMESYLEDQEALASERFLRRIRKARADVAKGKVVSSAEAKKRLKAT